MKTKLTITIKIILINLLFALSVSSSHGQTIISQNFDGVITPALPSGWTTTFNFNTGWRTDSSNFSTGYTSATGLKNCVIRNSDSSGTYILYSPIFATTGYSNITVLWGSRVSTNFPASGSSAPQFEYTTDGGASWSNIPYLENQANSIWALVNAGTRIAIGAFAENQPAVQFRWEVNIVTNPDGTYRLDDFDVQGTNTSGVNEIISGNTFSIFPNPATDKFYIQNNSMKSPDYTLEISDLSGKIIKRVNSPIFPLTIMTDHFSSGNYFLNVSEKGHIIYSQKLLVKP